MSRRRASRSARGQEEVDSSPPPWEARLPADAGPPLVPNGMEDSMSGTHMSSEAATEASGSTGVPMRFEVMVVPVSDVDRAKDFYQGLGWRLDADFDIEDGYRVIQFTPPGSPASIIFGTGTTTMEPGSLEELMLIVDDLDVARDELIDKGA